MAVSMMRVRPMDMDVVCFPVFMPVDMRSVHRRIVMMLMMEIVVNMSVGVIENMMFVMVPVTFEDRQQNSEPHTHSRCCQA